MLLVTVPVAQPVLQPCLSLNRLCIYIYIYIYIYRIYYIHCLLPSRAVRYCNVCVYIYTRILFVIIINQSIYIVKFYPSIYLSVYLPIYLSICLSVYLSIYLFVYIFLFYSTVIVISDISYMFFSFLLLTSSVSAGAL